MAPTGILGEGLWPKRAWDPRGGPGWGFLPRGDQLLGSSGCWEGMGSSRPALWVSADLPASCPWESKPAPVTCLCPRGLGVGGRAGEGGFSEQSLLPPRAAAVHTPAHGAPTALFLEQHQPRWHLSYQGKEEPVTGARGAGEVGAAGAASPGRRRGRGWGGPPTRRMAGELGTGSPGGGQARGFDPALRRCPARGFSPHRASPPSTPVQRQRVSPSRESYRPRCCRARTWMPRGRSAPLLLSGLRAPKLTAGREVV